MPADAGRFRDRGLPALLLAVLLFAAACARAGDAPPSSPEQVSDPALEAQVQRVAQELRCLVCQNQTIADSHAELAQDLRREVRQMLARGASEQEVREFMVARYGDFILYRPPFKATTLFLWLGPFVLLLAGLWTLRRLAVRRRAVVAAPELSADDAARLQALRQAPDGR